MWNCFIIFLVKIYFSNKKKLDNHISSLSAREEKKKGGGMALVDGIINLEDAHQPSHISHTFSGYFLK